MKKFPTTLKFPELFNYLSLIFFALEQTQVDLTVQSYNILLHFGFFFF